MSTRKEVEGADLSRILQSRIGWPSDEDLKTFMSSGQIINCTPTPDDVTRSTAIYGPSKPILQGKMTRKRPQHVQQIPRSIIPSPVLKHHPTDEIAVDFFFVNKRIYLLMKSRVYKFQGLSVSFSERVIK